MFEYLVDIVLGVLLSLTIMWCVLVHQRLRSLRGGQDEMVALVNALNGATDRAQGVVEQLKVTSEDARGMLGRAAQELPVARGDLDRLLDAAGRMSRRLESECSTATRTLAHLRTAIDFTPGSKAPARPEGGRQSVSTEDAGPGRRPASPRGTASGVASPGAQAERRPLAGTDQARQTAKALLKALEDVR